MKLTPQEVFNRLVDVDKIQSAEGQIRFFLGNVDIIVKQRDVVGNIIQEWLEGWLTKNNIEFAPNINTQMPPDIYLNPEDKKNNLLEVKAFNREATPGFDIADFKTYIREIVDKPYMLHSQYLIFGYRMSDEGIVTIKDLWLKNVWEITRSSNKWPVNVQYKNKIINKIRPCTWFATKNKYPIFESLEHFLSAIEETIYRYPDTRDQAVGWKERMEKSYEDFYGKKINIPRWMDIESNYRLK